MAAPDQVVGGASVEALGFTGWRINDQGLALLIAVAIEAALTLTPERPPLEATLLKRGAARRPTSRTPLGTAEATLAAAAAAAGEVGAGTIGARGIRARAVGARAIRACAVEARSIETRAIRAARCTGAIAEALTETTGRPLGAFTAVGTTPE